MTDTPTPAPVDLTPEVLARWEELATGATEGPWFREYGDVVVAKDDPRDRLKDEPRSQRVFEAAANWNLRDPQPIADAKFVVAARTAVPALLSGVRALQAENAELKEDHLSFPDKQHSLEHAHALYHDQPGNLIDRDGCEWFGCSFWDAAEFGYDAGVRSRDARIAELDAEVAARDAVIEDVRGAWTGADIDTALNAAPSSVLAARDAEKWDEGFNACALGGSLRNPYRAGVGHE